MTVWDLQDSIASCCGLKQSTIKIEKREYFLLIGHDISEMDILLS